MRSAIVLALVASGCPSPKQNNSPHKPPTLEEQVESPRKARQTKELDAMLADGLANWIIALSESPQTAQRPELPVDLAPTLRAALMELFSATETVARQTGDDTSEPPDLSKRVASVNQAFRSERLAYALDALVTENESQSDHVNLVLIFSFTIEDERDFRTDDGRSVQVRWARRLDKLGFRYRLIGFTSEGRQPLVLLGSIDRLICTGLFGHDGLEGAVAARSVAMGTRAAARAEAGAGAAELSDALAARKALLRRWRQEGLVRGLGVPATRLIEMRWREALKNVVPPKELERLGEIEKRLASVDVATAYDRLHRLIAKATEQHELQHQLDLDNKLNATLKIALNAEQKDFVLGEASAILAEIARSPKAAHLSLARLARTALAPGQSLERTATRVALAVIDGRTADIAGEELEVLIKSLALLPQQELAVKSRSAWQSLFGRPLEKLQRVHAPGEQASL